MAACHSALRFPQNSSAARSVTAVTIQGGTVTVVVLYCLPRLRRGLTILFIFSMHSYYHLSADASIAIDDTVNT